MEKETASGAAADEAAGPSEREILGRNALYSAVAGALGVMAAWLLWIAIQAWHKSGLEIFVPAVVGGVAAVLYERLDKHVRIARREAADGPDPEGELSSRQQVRAREQTHYGRMLGAAGVAGVLLGGVCTNLVGDLMSRTVAPFLIVLVTLAPVGAWFGFFFEVTRDQSDDLLSKVMRGLIAGVGAGVIAYLSTAVLGWGSLEGAQVLGTFAWWCLMGLGWSLVLHSEDFVPRLIAPVLGTLAAAFLVWISAINSSLGLLEIVRPLTDRLSGYALAHPGLPARFWKEAVEDYNRTHAQETAPPATHLLSRRRPQPEWVAPPPPSLEGKTPAQQRQLIIDYELSLGTRSGLLRSWMVLLAASFGVGVAWWSEPRLRARDYARSQTRRRDRQLAWLLGALWLAAVGGLWLMRW